MSKLIIPGLEEANRALDRATMPAVLERYRAMRVNQFLLDRVEALKSPVDPKAWVAFALRWNMPPPPNGFEDQQTLMIAIHSMRLALERTSPEDKLESALWLQSKMIPLPESMSIVNGELHGATYFDPTAQGGTS